MKNKIVLSLLLSLISLSVVGAANAFNGNAFAANKAQHCKMTMLNDTNQSIFVGAKANSKTMLFTPPTHYIPSHQKMTYYGVANNANDDCGFKLTIGSPSDQQCVVTVTKKHTGFKSERSHTKTNVKYSGSGAAQFICSSTGKKVTVLPY